MNLRKWKISTSLIVCSTLPSSLLVSCSQNPEAPIITSDPIEEIGPSNLIYSVGERVDRMLKAEANKVLVEFEQANHLQTDRLETSPLMIGSYQNFDQKFLQDEWNFQFPNFKLTKEVIKEELLSEGYSESEISTFANHDSSWSRLSIDVTYANLKWDVKIDPLTKKMIKQKIYVDKKSNTIIDQVKWENEHPSQSIDLNNDLRVDYTWPLIMSGNYTVKIIDKAYQNEDLIMQFNQPFNFEVWGFNDVELSISEFQERYFYGKDYHSPNKNYEEVLTYRYTWKDNPNGLATKDSEIIKKFQSSIVPYWYLYEYRATHPRFHPDWELPGLSRNGAAFVSHAKGTISANFRLPIDENIEIILGSFYNRVLPETFYLPDSVTFIEAPFEKATMPENFRIGSQVSFFPKTFKEANLKVGFTIEKGATIIEMGNTRYNIWSNTLEFLESWQIPKDTHWEIIDDDDSVSILDSLANISTVLSEANEIENEPEEWYNPWPDCARYYTFLKTIKLVVD